ncbi:hypothetical protein GCM10010341_88110 [Streptomyces noursei]|nr:hypothetical protein GCM10010341_88110 [Streptomyces noursei]
MFTQAGAVVVPAGVDKEAVLTSADGERDAAAGVSRSVDHGLEPGRAGGDVLSASAGSPRGPLIAGGVLNGVLAADPGDQSRFRATTGDVLAGEALEGFEVAGAAGLDFLDDGVQRLDIGLSGAGSTTVEVADDRAVAPQNRCDLTLAEALGEEDVCQAGGFVGWWCGPSVAPARGHGVRLPGCVGRVVQMRSGGSSWSRVRPRDCRV